MFIFFVHLYYKQMDTVSLYYVTKGLTLPSFIEIHEGCIKFWQMLKFLVTVFLQCIMTLTFDPKSHHMYEKYPWECQVSLKYKKGIKSSGQC